jgi:hypothetical protein
MMWLTNVFQDVKMSNDSIAAHLFRPRSAGSVKDMRWTMFGHHLDVVRRQNLIPIVAGQPNATSVWLYLLFSNRIETLLVLLENESHQSKGAGALADSVLFARKPNDEKVVISYP